MLYLFHSKIKSEKIKNKNKIKQHHEITILYLIQCKQLDTHTHKKMFKTHSKEKNNRWRIIVTSIMVLAF